MVEERQRAQAAVFVYRQRRHGEIQFAVAHRLLNRQSAELSNFQLHARVALAKQADRFCHQHPDHRRNPQSQDPFVQVINIAQLRFQLMKFPQNRLPTLKNNPTGIGQQEPAAIANQQGAVQLIFQIFEHFTDRGLCDEKFFRGARKTLLTHHFDKIAQRSDIHNYSQRLYL